MILLVYSISMIPDQISASGGIISISSIITVWGVLLVDIVEKALFESDINGPLSDLLCFLLTAIFNCIEEEEVEEEEMEGDSNKKIDRIDDTAEPGEVTYKELLHSATAASQIPYLNHG